MPNNYKICSNCVMDTTDPDIIFDENGVCDHCNIFYSHTLPAWQKKQSNPSALNKIIQDIKSSSKGKDFDCIIGMSGGVDSSYLTHYAATDLGLKPLVFHVDAGWNSKIAVNNIEKIIDKLDLDLFTEVIDWEEMQDLQLSFLKSGVSHIDTPQDHCFFAVMYKFASKYNIKYILTGGNLSTECIRNPVSWMYYQSDARQLKDIQRRFGARKLKNFPTTSILWHKLYLPYIRRIKTLRILDHIHYNKKEAIGMLEHEYGWESYGQKHFESRFTRFYEAYWLPKRFGFDTRRVQFSSLIVTNQMTREEAMEILEKPSYDEGTIHNDLEYVSNKLEISTQELVEYLEAPKKYFSDYKSQEKLYKLGSKIFKILNLEIGGKR